MMLVRDCKLLSQEVVTDVDSSLTTCDNCCGHGVNTDNRDGKVDQLFAEICQLQVQGLRK